MVSSSLSRGSIPLRDFQIRRCLDEPPLPWRGPLDTIVSSDRAKVRCRATITAPLTVRACARLDCIFSSHAGNNGAWSVLRTNTSANPIKSGATRTNPAQQKSPRPKGQRGLAGSPTVSGNRFYIYAMSWRSVISSALPGSSPTGKAP